MRTFENNIPLLDRQRQKNTSPHASSAMKLHNAARLDQSVNQRLSGRSAGLSLLDLIIDGIVHPAMLASLSCQLVDHIPGSFTSAPARWIEAP